MGVNVTLALPSFAAGELSPSLRARTDLAKYRVALALMRNCFSLPQGGAASRPGTTAVLRARLNASALNVTGYIRLIPFTFSTTQTYMLEFGYDSADSDINTGYMRVIMNGGYVLETAQSITSVTIDGNNRVNVSKVAHGYSQGDWIWFSGVTGMTELNSSPGFPGKIDTTGFSANAFRVVTPDGAIPANTATWGAFTAGNMARVYEISLPAFMYLHIPDMNYDQNADTMTFTSVQSTVFTLTRTSHTSWSFTGVTYQPTVKKPTGLTLTRNAAGTLIHRYVVSSVVDSTGEESEPSAAQDNTAAPSAALNQDTGVNLKLNWNAPASGPTPDRYNIYGGRRISNAGGVATLPNIYGYIGQSTTLDFTDTNIEPDFSRGPVKPFDLFSNYGLPKCSTYFGGRQWFAGTDSYPEIVMGSVVANYKNSYQHIPVRADDSIVVSLLSTQVNPIRHLISLDNLIALTDSGAWLISGSTADEPVTALSIRAKPQIYDGCSRIKPLNVSSDILYMSPSSSRMRTLAYDLATNLFTGTEVSLLASHLFIGYDITRLAYNEEPFGLVYALRNDGELNVMTYLKDQDVYAWGHWDTPGNSGVDDIVEIGQLHEGTEDTIYMVVKRTCPGVNGGNPVLMVERLASRVITSGGTVSNNLVHSLDSAIRTTGAGITNITGLHHLAGATALVYADGSLQGPKVVDSGGRITIDVAADNVLVGLPFTPQIQTLRLDLGEPSAQGKRKKVSRVTLAIENSRGIKVAPMKDDMNGDSVMGVLTEMRERTSQQTFGTALPWMNGVRTMIIQPGYQVDGSVFIEGTPGLPFNILSIIPTVQVTDG